MTAVARPGSCRETRTPEAIAESARLHFIRSTLIIFELDTRAPPEKHPFVRMYASGMFTRVGVSGWRVSLR